ncbi:MAG: hypothetical protein K6L80_06085 [Agarilytica sp.]
MKIKFCILFLISTFSSISYSEMVGYHFEGDITSAGDPAFTNFVGGTFQGTITYDDEAIPYQTAEDRAIAQGAIINYTFTDVLGQTYYLTIENASFGLIHDFLAGDTRTTLDVFSASNWLGEEAPQPSVISSDFPFNPELPEPIGRVTLFGNELFSNTSFDQFIDLTKADMLSRFDIITDTGETNEEGFPIIIYHIQGDITAFDPIEVTTPPQVVLANDTSIGYFDTPGSFEYDVSSDTYSMQTSGSNIGQWEDWFYYVYEAVSGDIDLRARVQYISEGWASAGIMIRKDLTSGSPFSASLITRNEGGQFISRQEAYTPYPAINVPELEEGYWLRLVKTGNVVVNYISNDGINWNQVGTETIEFGENFYVGISSMSENPYVQTDIIIEDVTIEVTP